MKTRRTVRFLLIQVENNAWLCVVEAEVTQVNGESGLDSDEFHPLKDLVYSTLDTKASFHVAAPVLGAPGDPIVRGHWIRAPGTQFRGCFPGVP